MGETCSHVAAALYRVEDVVQIGFTSPAVKAMPLSVCQIENILAYLMPLIRLKIRVTSRKTDASLLKSLRNLQWAQVEMNIGLNITNA